MLKLMRLAKDILSSAEFWIESQFTAYVSRNGWYITLAELYQVNMWKKNRIAGYSKH